MPSQLMFKTLTAIHRREHLTFDEFMSHWTEIHANLIQQHAAALGIVKYIQLHHTASPKSDSSVSSSRPQYDGIAEVWYQSEHHFRALGKSEAGRAAVEKVVEDQKKFIGSEIPLFRGYESEIISP